MKKTVCFKVNKAYLNNRFFTESGNLDFYYKVKLHLESKGYLVGSTYYGTFAEVASAVTIGDTVETITVTSTQVVGLVESKEG